ncbi:hypothetical protein ABPG77_010614 [Micractinium sp. CCAP 211/92]
MSGKTILPLLLPPPLPPPLPLKRPEPLELTVSLASGMEHVGQAEWDLCATAGSELNPFVLHSFLHALESSGSAVRDEGWLPQHVLVRGGSTGELLGCCPMYLKGHSYGEYVFDQSWADAYHRMFRKPYYPKLLVGVPFTPVPGPRLLVKPGPHGAAVRRALADSLKQVADQFGVSSLHINFTTEAEFEALGAEHGYLQRTGIQYHWYNGDVSRSMLASSSSTDDDEAAATAAAAASIKYSSFDDGDGSFLAALRQSKRKSIRQARAKEGCPGGAALPATDWEDIRQQHWDAFYKFYRNTTDRKWGSAYLTRAFFSELGFSELGERMADRVLLVLAETADGAPGHGRPVAGALNLIGSHALFGRNWGCIYGDRVPNLHFELCYYQALEFAIERGLQRVEAGAQGEHKLQRGYLPSPTYSLHYLPSRGFSGCGRQVFAAGAGRDCFALDMLRQEASPYKQP